MKTTDRAIFLHRIPYSETSMVVSMYTANHGLLKCMFKGGKKKAHNLFPLSVLEISFFRKNESQLANLTSADSAYNVTFPFDPVKSTIAFFIAELIRKTMHTNESEEGVFKFFNEQIMHLESRENMQLFPLEFMVLYTKQLGIQPLMETSIIDQHLGFGVEEGEFNHNKSLIRFESGPHVELLFQMFNEDVLTEPIGKQVRTKALELLIRYYQHHISDIQELETYDIVKEILS